MYWFDPFVIGFAIGALLIVHGIRVKRRQRS